MSDLELLCRKCHEAEHAKDHLKKKSKEKPRKTKKTRITPRAYWQMKKKNVEKLAAATGYSYEFLHDLKIGTLNHLAQKYKVKVKFARY